MKSKIIKKIILIFFGFLVFCFCENKLVINPYEGINWEKVKRLKANLHTHTTNSDGKLTPQQVIELYKNSGYSIISITDHDKYTFLEGNYGIFIIKGIEFTGKKGQHHIISFFNSYLPDDIQNFKEEKILENSEGILFFAHPSRYNKEIEWYLNFFRKYNNLKGIEVLNPEIQIRRGKIYGDKDIWDKILKRIMPERNIYGVGNDDFHKLTEFGINWNEILVENLDEKEIKKAIENGRFFICSSITGRNLPFIEKIILNEKRGEILIECKNYKEIKWISNGEIVEKGKKINYKKNPKIKNYLRVEIYNEGFIYLNPFGFKN